MLRLHDRSSSRQSRRGMTLTEMGVALVILTVAMIALVQLVGTAAQQRRRSDQRRLALQEIGNQAERLSLVSWEEVAPGELASWEPSAGLSAVLPQAACHVEVCDEDGSPAARRIRLSVTWQNATGQRVEPVELTVWRFRPEAKP
jgi:uncharacterized membrane protein